jgi:hypothetical protein
LGIILGLENTAQSRDTKSPCLRAYSWVSELNKKCSFILFKTWFEPIVFNRFFGSLEKVRLRRSVCPEPREARRGLNSVRAISKIHRQSGFFKGKDASRGRSPRSATILYWFLGEKENWRLRRTKEHFLFNLLVI